MKQTQNLSSQITGNDYLSAYHSRMEVNNRYFIDMSKELTAAGYKVYVPNHGLIPFIHVESKDKHITFGFTDIPYRWYLSCSIGYKLGNGSSRTLKEIFDYDSPFTVADIVSNMQPIVPQIVEPSQYLQLFTI